MTTCVHGDLLVIARGRTGLLQVVCWHGNSMGTGYSPDFHKAVCRDPSPLTSGPRSIPTPKQTSPSTKFKRDVRIHMKNCQLVVKLDPYSI